MTLAVAVFDAIDPAPVCRIVKVTSTGGPDLNRDGDRDWVITGPLTVLIESATKQRRNRRYSIAVRCTDAAGNASRDRASVVVSRLP